MSLKRMTRQHFQALAEVIAECAQEGQLSARQIDLVASNIATMCKRFNSSFDETRFVDAILKELGINPDSPRLEQQLLWEELK